MLMASSRAIRRLLPSPQACSFLSKSGAPRSPGPAAPPFPWLAFRNYTSGSPPPPPKVARAIETELRPQNPQQDEHYLLKQRMKKLQGDMEKINREIRESEKAKLEANTEEMHDRLKEESVEFNDKLTSGTAILREATKDTGLMSGSWLVGEYTISC